MKTENTEKKIALLQHLEEKTTKENINLIKEIYNNIFSFDGGDEYLICTNNEAEQYWEEYIENYIDDCVLHEIPENYRNYFDYEKFKRDCSYDGRGHTLNHYDGVEHEEKVNDIYYYLYQQ